jgi:hypothetical protein
MGRLSRRLLLSTSLVAVASLLGPPTAGHASQCTLTGTLVVCPPGTYTEVGGALDNLAIEFLPGPTDFIAAGPGVIGIENSVYDGFGTLQSVRLGDHGITFRPVGARSSAIGIFARSGFKPVDALLTGKMDVDSSASIRSTVFVGASGNVTVDISGRIRSTGERANALHIESWDGNVDVRASAAISTSGDGASAVIVDRINPNTAVRKDGNGVLYNSDINPDFEDPPAGTGTFAPITRGSVDVQLTGPITVEGFEYRPDRKQPSVPASGVIVRNQAGDVNVTTGDITLGSPTRAPSSVGILANALDGNVNVNLNGNLKLFGSGVGIWAVAPDGVATINALNPLLIDKAFATYIRAEAGSFNITTGDVTMTAANPDEGVFSARPRLFQLLQFNNDRSTVTTGAIDVSTFNTDAFTGDVKNADITFKSITMSGNKAKAVFASGPEVEPGDGPQARLGVNGPITQTGRDAWGVYFRLLDATINSNITQRGANSLGIYADGLGYSPVLLHSTGSITSSGDNSNGIFAQQMLIGFDPNAFIRVRSDGAITMTGRNATGALLDNYITPDESLEEIFGYPYFFGAANVAATFNGEVKSTGAGGRAIEILGREVTLNLNGDTLGGTDSAQRAGAGVVIRGSRQVTINNTGTLSSGNLAALSATSEG